MAETKISFMLTKEYKKKKKTKKNLSFWNHAPHQSGPILEN